MSEIRDKEEELLQHELGEIENKAAAETQKEQFFQQVQEDVVIKYLDNFVDLQEQLRKLKAHHEAG